MNKVAIIGTGIAGMACAHRLHQQVDLTLFEAEMEPGGHTHTVDVPEGGSTVPMDTGFMVYNETTYPLLTQLFGELGVETMETDMSFGVQYRPHGLEYCGSSLNQIFAQRTNLLNGRYWRMLADIIRFNRLATDMLSDPDILDMTLQDFVKRHHFHKVFLEYYLLPMTSAIWTTPPGEMLNFPAHTLIRFMYNHGLLGINTQHQWRTVKGGSRQYRNRLIAPFRDRIHCGVPVTAVERRDDGVRVHDASGKSHPFDLVVMATHADISLSLLANPTPLENATLRCFPYSSNLITVHNDTGVMPSHRRAWASWNYRIDTLENGLHQASTHYWMNALQSVSENDQYFVSVNDPGLVDRKKIFREFTFDHPMFSKAAAEAQRDLPKLNEEGNLFFCGSYFRYGFHEDGILSGYAAADRILTRKVAHAQLAV